MAFRAARAALLLFFLVAETSSAYASQTSGTIDSSYKYAWSNVGGYINFKPSAGGLTITDSAVTGYAWSANTGWINFNATQSHVTNNSSGTLGGYAWDAGAGWVSFTGVTIDTNGKFHGSATGGTVNGASYAINFDCTNCDVRTDWRPASARTTTTTTTPAPAVSISSGGGGGGSFSSPLVASNVSLSLTVTPSATSLPAGGGSVTYTYAVSNTGAAPILGVSVTDTACSPVLYSSGDTNGDSSIYYNSLYTNVDGVWASRNVNEVWIFRCTTKLATTTENTATVIGNGQGFRTEATARSSVTVGVPTLATPLTPPPAVVAAPASGLTSVQANAILSLLTSFDADSAVIASVRAVLFGTGVAANVSSVSASSFTRDLELGAKGNDVKALQEFLIKQNGGFATQHLSAIGASGYFGSLTRAALAEFQAIQGITPSVGYFGPKTRDSIKNLIPY